MDEETGLKPVITYRIVSDHAGSIEVSSRPGEGPCFFFRLPTKPPQLASSPGSA